MRAGTTVTRLGQSWHPGRKAEVMSCPWLLRRFLACSVLLAVSCLTVSARQGGTDGGERHGGDWLLVQAPVNNQRGPAGGQDTPVTPQGTPILPNGATSISEVYGAWTVQCRVVSNKKLCTLNQVLANQKTEQVGFAIDLFPSEGSVLGHVLLPLGIRLADGLVLQVDKHDPASKLQFTHCVAAGCIAAVQFNHADTKTLEAGTTLAARVTVETSGQPLTLQISLVGFGAALARTSQLQR
ncbi:invasion associated locus B family protein [Mesorhizobium helmanticense]|uniref:Invasion protein n=1 Tax=Mesorhizobium helmanticense TaxID=1776423 RepID=A0A2T4IQJ9_9HYPH|nr:hypothetical protein C9427_23335 [Mesorhizobium helmanticense]